MNATAAGHHRELPDDVARRLIGHATRAPSMHNTQPWLWRIRDDGVELYADLSRRLPVEDPMARNLVISCGAALHHLQVAARSFGWATMVDRLPDAEDHSLLARVRMHPSNLPSDLPDLAAIHERRTDRRRFTSWPVPDARLQRLTAIAEEWGCHAVALTDDYSRIRMELLVETARARLAASATAAGEQSRWIDRGHDEGIPSRLIPVRGEDDFPSRFGPGLLTAGDADLESSDGIIVLGGTSDDAGAWLRTGEGLSALWLRATQGALSVVPLSHAVEVERTRATLRHELLGGLVIPHIVLRVGWQTIGRSELPKSPRRPVDDVLWP